MEVQYKIVRKEHFLNKVVLFEVVAPQIAEEDNTEQMLSVWVTDAPLTIVSTNPKKGTITLVIHDDDSSTKKICKLEVGDSLISCVSEARKKIETGDLPLIVCPSIGVKMSPLLSRQNRAMKRGFDILFSSFFLVTLFPFFLLFVAIGTTLSSPGSLFFVQKRTGYNGKEFKCYKFRSMIANKQSATLQATRNDSRVTRFGSFLRKSSLDELPQFINVLLGDMSIIGPRPHMLKHTEQYAVLIGKYMARHFIKPGITGWAQIHGYRGETKELIDMEKRVKSDIWYIEHWSMKLDIKIVFRTIRGLWERDANAF